ncbi:retron St85 family RNA-directed DNA polymerase [Novilysobacter spongiicola]|uniref:RNA-directed DNA polymerase n=1 Tax=Lysobacter spongiicola DSM 21749 TaxID=1122188 RepID=A0A1T4RIU6_9GAMM|nr:retron St85 family RNA-directed DNA polymerase [Lysobacter spongiicola]SKA15895.1 Reverse transcriptase (RNA-dependent DNA polymerase) [Lysobacter spongiicola DSM 21749]
MTTRLVNRLSQQVGLPAGDIERIISSAPRRYKEFKIRKRSGSGFRDIAQPSRELKILQKAVVEELKPHLPIHDCVHGYVIGRGIKSNAAAHRKGRFILKMDFADFFPSIKPVDFRAHLRESLPDRYDDIEARQLELLLFWLKRGERTLRMCIGAPSSPSISNYLMYAIDSRITENCRLNAVTYTRYADDLTFSCGEEGILGEVEGAVSRIVGETVHPRLRINPDKTIHISRKQRRTVTGVNITPTGELSIGRDRKRLIRAMVHRHIRGLLDLRGQNELIGLLGFAHDVEPSFAQKMWASLKGAPALKRSRRVDYMLEG